MVPCSQEVPIAPTEVDLPLFATRSRVEDPACCHPSGIQALKSFLITLSRNVSHASIPFKRL